MIDGFITTYSPLLVKVIGFSVLAIVASILALDAFTRLLTVVNVKSEFVVFAWYRFRKRERRLERLRGQRKCQHPNRIMEGFNRNPWTHSRDSADYSCPDCEKKWTEMVPEGS